MAKGKRVVLCDTNIIIEAFRKNQSVLDELRFHITYDAARISTVTVGEVYQGMKKNEKQKTRELLDFFDVIRLDKSISIQHEQWMLGYRDQGLQVCDALIGATASVTGMELFTFNRKDFDFIYGLKLYNPRVAKPLYH